MRQIVIGGLCGAALAFAVAGRGGPVEPAFAQRLEPAGSSQLVTHSLALDGQRQQLVVIDPATRAMAVYQVSGASGEIALKSVRNIHYDLQMVEFNSQNPLPQEIKTLLEQK